MELEKFIKKNKIKNVHLIEWIDNAASYLKAFDIFVLPSIKEGLSFSILEAMKAKTPIIATNVGGIPELIQDDITGLLIQPKKVKELKSKIKYLIDHPEQAKEMAQKAKEKAENEFSLEETIRKTRDLYEN